MNGKANSSAVAQQSSTVSSVRLLLHAIDGAFPYLTPSLCRRCFPAEQVGDVLAIGIAVRDTCLVPVFEDDKKSNRKTACSNSKIKDASKPRGYTFSASAKLDTYMLAYDRVTVPTFDLYQDAATYTHKTNDPLDAATINLPLASTYLHLWTANGRHQITPKEYAACADNLNSAMTVPLFDMLPPLGEGSTGIEEEDALLLKRRTKRIHAVTKRNKQWTEAMESFLQHGSILTPVAVSIDGDPTPEIVQWATEKFGSTSGNGIAFVGLQYMQGSDKRLNVLRSFLDARLACPMTLVALSTATTLEIVELLRISTQASSYKVMIGTCLPTQWARSKKAFLCDFLHSKPINASSSEIETKRRRITDQVVPADALDEDGCFDLNTDDGASVDEHPWFRDSAPLVAGCHCLTCTSYSRSFLYHLVCSKELLAETLLFIHNLHHLLSLLRAFQKLQSDNETDAAISFCDTIEAQCKSVAQ